MSVSTIVCDLFVIIIIYLHFLSSLKTEIMQIVDFLFDENLCHVHFACVYRSPDIANSLVINHGIGSVLLEYSDFKAIGAY